MENKIKGGKADNMTTKDIADKFKVSIEKINTQIKKGVGVEMEHTKDKEKAIEIAMDHLSEFPDYYDRLEKMEKNAEKEFKPVKESQKKLIKKLLREEIEEGKLGRMAGTIGMAAATLGSPSIHSMDKTLTKSEKIGVSKKEDGSIISIAKSDGPTKEFAKELAINKAKNQLAYSLKTNEDFDIDIIDIKFEKNKGRYFCTIQIALKK